MPPHRDVVRLKGLVDDPALAHGAGGDLLVHGDNLPALIALEPLFAGRVRCVCIDPPYNTGATFRAYPDAVEHGVWLERLRERLVLLRRLLADDGSLWVFADDNEAHYLKVVGDEVFGREHFVQTVIWQRKASPANDARWISNDHDYVLVYAKDKARWRPRRLGRSARNARWYTNPDGDPRGPWNSVTYTCNKSAEERPNLYYPLVRPSTGEAVWPKRTAVWRCNAATHARNEAAGLVYWGKDGGAAPRLKRFLAAARPVVPRSVWLHEEVGHTQTAMRESKALFGDDPFPTPKPEAVIARVLALATDPGDLVLDAFAGSGTTGAVATKMGRRWILIEQGEAAITHCVPRLRRVVDGADPGGVTRAMGWKGGGGFRFARVVGEEAAELES